MIARKGSLQIWALIPGIILISGCGKGRSLMDLWRGNRAYHQETFDQALARYREALREAPRDPRPVFNSGAAQYKLGRLEEAQKSFSSLAVPLKLPAILRSQSFYNLGNTHYRKNEIKEAAEAYKQCLLLNPSDEDCRHNLVKVLQQLKNPQSQKDKKEQQKKSGGQDQKQPPQNQDPQKSGSKPDRSRPQSGLSQEDAQRILQAVQERQKEIPRPQPSWQKQPDRPPEEVDW